MFKIRRALVSVSDKHGIAEFAHELATRGIELLSTGGTSRLLREQGVDTVDVADRTGFPEIMDGRVKTLHPVIHGGLLGRRGMDDAVMSEHGIEPIDLLVVNLYPFEATIAKPDVTLADAVENIDIGGPAMIRAAAKNHSGVVVIVDPNDYAGVVAAIDADTLSEERRRALSAKAFAHTAGYDAIISDYLGRSVERSTDTEDLADAFNYAGAKVTDLRYGENPHQHAAFYRDRGTPAQGSLANAEQLQGKALSYNNIADSDAALECVRQFDEPACVIVKHANPCGVAVAESINAAYDLAFKTDPTSAFGGIIAFNREVDETTAAAIIERQFVEVVIAPAFSATSREQFAKKKNVRVLETGALSGPKATNYDFKKVSGGLLVQSSDTGTIAAPDLKIVTARAPTDNQIKDLLFAWQVVKYVKSNAIVFCRDRTTIGIGAGQMSRVYSTKIAAIKAGDEGLAVRESVMASDAFFPFRDGIDAAAEHGIGAIIQPGGSMRDEEVIAAANEHDIAMVFTGMRHFRH